MVITFLVYICVAANFVEGGNPWSNACGDGTHYNCMKNVAGPFRCSDMSKCTSYDDCDDEAAAYRSGNLCHDFPWYNGGYPMGSIKFNHNAVQYNCTQPSVNGTYCENSEYINDSLSSFAYGSTLCLNQSTNGNYCQSWQMEQIQYKRCWKSDNKNDADTTTICCNSQKSNLCCQEICSVSYYNAYPPTYEYGNCNCIEESTSGKYCQQWTCEEYTSPSQSEWDGRIYESYECKQGDSNQNMCMNWQGNSHSVKKFELSNNTCDIIANNGLYCQIWSSQGKSVNMWYPNLLWTLLPIFLGIWPPFAYCLAAGSNKEIHDIVLHRVGNSMWDQQENKDKWVTFGLFYIFPTIIFTWGFLLIAIWQAGLGVFFTAGIITVFPFPLYLLWLYLFHPHSRRHPKKRTIQMEVNGDLLTKEVTDPTCTMRWWNWLTKSSNENSVSGPLNESQL